MDRVGDDPHHLGRQSVGRADHTRVPPRRVRGSVRRLRVLLLALVGELHREPKVGQLDVPRVRDRGRARVWVRARARVRLA